MINMFGFTPSSTVRKSSVRVSSKEDKSLKRQFSRRRRSGVERHGSRKGSVSKSVPEVAISTVEESANTTDAEQKLHVAKGGDIFVSVQMIQEVIQEAIQSMERKFDDRWSEMRTMMLKHQGVVEQCSQEVAAILPML